MDVDGHRPRAYGGQARVRHADRAGGVERRGDVPDPLARTAAGRSLRTTWTVTPPEGAPTGSYDLILRTSYRSPSGFRVDNALPLDRDRGGAATLGDVRAR